MTLRYIGSKTRIGEELSSFIGRPDGGRFVDAFCGMGSVAEQAVNLGWSVAINDHLAYAVVMSGARFASVDEVPFRALGGYEAAIEKLNGLSGRKGFIWREYSPAAAHQSTAGIERRYFSEDNAKRIDAVRAEIFDWRRAGFLNDVEERVLVADLLGAANRVANIAGTYGCFLATWTAQSRGELCMRARPLRQSRTPMDATVGDVSDLAVRFEDTVYLDPPYTKRQYASYYHILETITLGDAPVVEGVSGLRPWRHLASDYCYKRRALAALSGLITSMPAHRILLSYSDEGHVDLGDLEAALHGIGQIVTHPLASIGRYRPNQTASDAGASVHEYLMVIDHKREQRRASSGSRR